MHLARSARRPWGRPNRGTAERGATLVEVLIAALIVGIAGVGTALMFSSGQAYIQAEGDNRVALQLAQQRIEEIRAAGFGPATGTDPREEATEVDLSTIGHPGYRRTTTVQSMCPNNFSAQKTSPTSCGSPFSFGGVEVKLFTVTVRAVYGSTTQTDPKTSPVVLQTLMVRY